MTANATEVDWDLPAIERVVGRCPGAPGAAIEQLEQYARLLYRWSARMSLISIGDRPNLVHRHLIPCLAMVPSILTLPHETILDFGSGSGLPGIPIKIMLPDSYLTLVDSRRRRVSFLREVVRTTKLQRIEVFHGRLADWPGPAASPDKVGVDMVVARAVDDPESVYAETEWTLATGGNLLTTLGPVGCTKKTDSPSRRLFAHKIAWNGGEQWIGVVPKRGPAD